MFISLYLLPLGLVREGGWGSVWGRRVGEVEPLDPLTWVHVSSRLLLYRALVLGLGKEGFDVPCQELLMVLPSTVAKERNHLHI